MVLTLNGKDVVIKTAGEAAIEAIKYIADRKSGLAESLKSRWMKFNNMCSIEPNTLFTVSGISGSGKSTFVNMLETDLIEQNPNQDIVVLSFSLEMKASQQIGRKLSTKTNHTTMELYSSSTKLSDATFDKVKLLSKGFTAYPIYYIEGPIDIETVSSTITRFQETIAKDKWLVITFDHTLLVDGSGSEKSIIDALQKVFMKAKKIGKTSIVQIAQLNRGIELSDRIKLPAMHYPMRSDLSTSDFMYQCSDYVGVLHRPEILGILNYGTQHLPTANMLFFHLLKNREGEVGIIPFINDLKYNNIAECTKNEVTSTTLKG